MTRVRVIGLIVSATALIAAATTAPSAQAAPMWKLNGETVKLETKVELESIGHLKLFEGGSTPIECAMHGKGHVGPGGEGGIKEVTFSECGLSGCQPVTVEAKNLPWPTELFEETGGTQVRDRIMHHSLGGEPGWASFCQIGELIIYEECLGQTGMAMENVSGGVLGMFDEKSSKLACFNERQGTIQGSILFKNPPEGKLTVG